MRTHARGQARGPKHPQCIEEQRRGARWDSSHISGFRLDGVSCEPQNISKPQSPAAEGQRCSEDWPHQAGRGSSQPGGAGGVAWSLAVTVRVLVLGDRKAGTFIIGIIPRKKRQFY